MKKLQFDKAAVQAFLLEHVEKVVFGLAALIFVWLAYASVQVERFTQTPTQLADSAVNATKSLESTPKDEPPVVVQEYAKQAEQIRLPVRAESYAFKNRWDTPLIPKRKVRFEPAVFAVEKLQGAAEIGAFSMAADGAAAGGERPTGRRAAAAMEQRGGAGIRGQRWIVVTGLVPIDKQMLAFSELKNCVVYDASTDTPRYLGYKVERVEVSSADEADKPDWTKATSFISGLTVQQARGRWTGEGREIVSPDVLDPDGVLAFPLGPMTNREWDESVAHAPEITLPSSETPEAMQPRTPMQRERATPTSENPYGEKPTATAMPIETMEAGKLDVAKKSQYFLFRFFDYSVESGKRYVYRVQIGLRNPNYKLKPALLAKPELAKSIVLETKWSTPSPAIFVPHDTRILAVSMTAGRGRTEPVAKVLMVKWLEEKGIEVSKEYSLLRGQVANFTDKTTVKSPKVVKPATKPATKPPARGTPAGRTPTRTPARGEGPMREPMMEMPVAAVLETPVTVNYFSDAIALDFRGGETLRGRKSGSAKLTAPADILVVNADGTLALHNELDEKADRLKLTSRDTEMRPQMPVRRGGLEGMLMGP